jgi:hypothetical protein
MSFATDMLFMGGFITTPDALASVTDAPAVASGPYTTPSVTARKLDAARTDARALSADCQLCA